MNTKNKMWVEKYRPKNLDEIIFKDKEKIRNFLKNNESMPHLLFHSSSAGLGKTSLAYIIIKELGADHKIINASDERKIDTIREQITEFVRAKSSKDNTRRIVMLDEADGLLPASQDALRNLMETYASNALFILTANVESKIIEPIKSRCVSINFSKPEKEDIKKYLENVCIKESLEYDEQGLEYVVEVNYPSIRNAIKQLQVLYAEGKNVTKGNVVKREQEEYEKLYNYIIKDYDWKAVRDYVFTNNVDVQSLNKYIWGRSVSESNIKHIQITCSNEKNFKSGADPIVVFVTSLIDMVK